MTINKMGDEDTGTFASWLSLGKNWGFDLADKVECPKMPGLHQRPNQIWFSKSQNLLA